MLSVVFTRETFPSSTLFLLKKNCLLSSDQRSLSHDRKEWNDDSLHAAGATAYLAFLFYVTLKQRFIISTWVNGFKWLKKLFRLLFKVSFSVWTKDVWDHCRKCHTSHEFFLPFAFFWYKEVQAGQSCLFRVKSAYVCRIRSRNKHFVAFCHLNSHIFAFSI